MYDYFDPGSMNEIKVKTKFIFMGDRSVANFGPVM